MAVFNGHVKLPEGNDIDDKAMDLGVAYSQTKPHLCQYFFAGTMHLDPPGGDPRGSQMGATWQLDGDEF